MYVLINLLCELLCSGDTAYSLGTAMDELMRHQPMLKPDAMKAIVKVHTYIIHLTGLFSDRLHQVFLLIVPT